MSSRIGALWRTANELADRRLGAAILVLAAFGVYAVRTVAWPVTAGRDLDDYLRYYVELLHDDPVLPAIMLGKTPLTPIVDGLLLDVAGGRLATLGLACMYAFSILAWTALARLVSTGAAVVVSVALLAWPGYGMLFHEISSEPVSASIFAGWGLLVGRAVSAPSAARFALVGAGVAVATLARPGNQVLVVVAFLPLLVRAPLGSRLVMTTASLAAAVVPLAAWALVNGARYGEVTLARGSIVFHHAFVVDRIVDPENGPRTRRFLDAVEDRLLTREPYRSYGVDLSTILSSGSLRVSEDLGVFAHEQWGWDGGPAILGGVGREAVRAHAGAYAKNTLRSIWLELSEPVYRPEGAPAETDPEAAGTASTVAGTPLPAPTEGEPIPAGQSGWLIRPDNGIRLVWATPTETSLVFSGRDLEERYREVERRVDALFAALGDRAGSPTFGLRLNQLSRWFPRPVVWLVAGLVVLLIRRPRREIALALLTPAMAGLLVIAATAAAAPPDVRYALPVAPAFVVLAVGSLLAGRRPATGGRVTAPSRGSIGPGRPVG